MTSAAGLEFQIYSRTQPEIKSKLVFNMLCVGRVLIISLCLQLLATEAMVRAGFAYTNCSQALQLAEQLDVATRVGDDGHKSRCYAVRASPHKVLISLHT